jgi:N-acetylglutamate synthase/N-acetylornithine aminotransferase
MKEIIDHEKDLSAISHQEGFYTSSIGNQVKRKTMEDWKLCVEEKDGTTAWVQLSELKVSNPVEVAEYVIANKIVEKPALA